MTRKSLLFVDTNAGLGWLDARTEHWLKSLGVAICRCVRGHLGECRATRECARIMRGVSGWPAGRLCYATQVPWAPVRR